MILWTVLTWMLTLLLLPIMGFNAVAVALLTITSTVALVVILLKRVVPFSFFGMVRTPILGVLVQYVVASTIIARWGGAVAWTAIAESAGVILFGVVLFVFEREKVKLLWDQVRQVWKR